MAQRGLVRRDPFLQDLWDFRRNFDDIFGRFFEPTGAVAGRDNSAWLPAVECYVDQNKYHVRVALPGVDQKDVRVQVHGDELSISGDRSESKDISDDRYLQREFSYGHFERIVRLPEGVEPDKVQAKLTNGVLEVEAPIAEKSLPKQIQVQSSESGGKKLAA